MQIGDIVFYRTRDGREARAEIAYSYRNPRAKWVGTMVRLRLLSALPHSDGTPWLQPGDYFPWAVFASDVRRAA